MEGKNKAQARYDRANTTAFKMKLNNKTDADILEWLSKQDNKQGSVKALIRAEIFLNGKDEKNMRRI